MTCKACVILRIYTTSQKRSKNVFTTLRFVAMTSLLCGKAFLFERRAKRAVRERQKRRAASERASRNWDEGAAKDQYFLVKAFSVQVCVMIKRDDAATEVFYNY